MEKAYLGKVVIPGKRTISKQVLKWKGFLLLRFLH